MAVQCVWVEPSGRAQRHLRRYTNAANASESGWSCAAGWHNAKRYLDEIQITRDPVHGTLSEPASDTWPHDDPHWPTACDRGCGYVFRPDDAWQVFVMDAWQRPDTGEIVSWGLNDALPGTMWDARWMPDGWVGDDGIKLTVQLPDGLPWLVDGPVAGEGRGHIHDTRTGHRCWTRTGDPRAVPPTVSAEPSILTPKYHGWLRAGTLVDA